MLTVRSSAIAFVAALAFAGAAKADTIFDTGFGQSDFGYVGEDIFPGQSVGVAFQPSANYTLDSVGLWMMSNDFDNPGRTFSLKLVTDTGPSPSTPNESNVLESWNNLSTDAVGWNPVLDTFNSAVHPQLNAGQWYWLVASSNEEAGLDPLWTWASNDVQYYSGQNEMDGSGWQGGYSFGSTPGTVINGSAVPEPASLGLIALAGVGTLRRRRA